MVLETYSFVLILPLARRYLLTEIPHMLRRYLRIIKMKTMAGIIIKKPPANLKFNGEASKVAMICAGKVRF
ncbi:MAG TPA: hypothetical protein DDW93_05115 [Firmicutes bacterium]|nr:hypothetical protein [Bacillota bacterium]